MSPELAPGSVRCRVAPVVPFLRPTDAWGGRPNGQHLARACRSHGSHVRRTTPLRHHHEQPALVRAPERAREAATVQIDGLQHLPTSAHTHATLFGNVPVPDGVCGVEAYT